MIERQDVIRCDHLRIIATGPNAGRGARCRVSFTTPDGITAALKKALDRGWIQIRDSSGRRCHLCPQCARLTDNGRQAVLVGPEHRAKWTAGATR